MKTIEELAKEAYKVYGKTTGNKNFLGQQPRVKGIVLDFRLSG